jgi:actin-like protein 6A
MLNDSLMTEILNRDRLLVDPKEHPMLLAEPSFNTQQNREKMVELMFEKYGAPAVFLAKNAVLTSFASGRATSLVVDCGGASTNVAAVHDGYVLQKAIVKSAIGGDVLTECLLKTLESKGISIRPRFSFKRKEVRIGEFEVTPVEFPNTTESYYKYMQRVIAADVKEAVCRVPDSPFDDNSYANIPTTPYELPDGQMIEVGADRFRIPDIMFNPSLLQVLTVMEVFCMIKMLLTFVSCWPEGFVLLFLGSTTV